MSFGFCRARYRLSPYFELTTPSDCATDHLMYRTVSRLAVIEPVDALCWLTEVSQHIGTYRRQVPSDVFR